MQAMQEISAAELPFIFEKRADPYLILKTPKGGRVMKDLISYIARALVDFPDKVEVSAVEGRHTTVLELRVAKKDMGKIIGRQGRTAQAIRTILSAASGKTKKRHVLEIIE